MSKCTCVWQGGSSQWHVLVNVAELLLAVSMCLSESHSCVVRFMFGLSTGLINLDLFTIMIRVPVREGVFMITL